MDVVLAVVEVGLQNCGPDLGNKIFRARREGVDCVGEGARGEKLVI